MFGYFKKKKLEQFLKRHSAGATVIHKSPFDQIKVPYKIDSLSQEFIQKWVFPFYMERLLDSDNFEENFIQLKNDLTDEIIVQLLGYFNWRSRITGAYFSAIMDFKKFEDTIGTLFLKSEVCYAGEAYIIALSTFNTDKSIDYLIKYLDYYLSKTDLWFDQGDALAALIWLDSKNNTTFVSDNNYIEKWTHFISNKPNWNLDNFVETFNLKKLRIEKIQERIANGI